MPIVSSLANASILGFGAFSKGNFESIATVRLGSAAASMDFTSIPSGFQHLQIRFIVLHSNGANGLYTFMRFNGDTGANYRVHRLTGDGTSSTAGNTTSPQVGPHLSGSNANTVPTLGVIDVLDYGSTTKTKTVRAVVGADSNGVGEISIISLLWASTASVSSISISAMSQGSASTFAQYTAAALYGIRS